MKAETTVAQARINEVFSGSELSDSFHRLLTKSPYLLDDQSKILVEAFFFAGAGTVFKQLDRAHDTVSETDGSVEERSAAYASVFDRMQEEINNRATEGLVAAITKLLRSVK